MHKHPLVIAAGKKREGSDSEFIKTIPESATPPSNPDVGQLWLDTSIPITNVITSMLNSMEGYLITEQVLSSSQASVVFSSLNSLVDGDYTLVCKIIGLATNNWMSLYINGDTTATNYVTEYRQSYASTGIDAQLTGGMCFYHAASLTAVATINIKVLNNRAYFTCSSLYDRTANTDLGIIDSASYYKNSIQAITSISLVGNSASIGIGSKFTLYKSQAPKQLQSTYPLLLGGITGNCIEEKTISTAIDRVIFTGLDSIVDGDYRVEMLFQATGTEAGVFIYFNDDLTDSNYECTCYAGYVNSTSVAGPTLKSTSYIGDSRPAQGGASYWINIRILNGIVYFWVEGVGYTAWYTNRGRYKTSVTRITSLTILAKSATFNTGSIFRLYSSKTPTQLISYQPQDFSSLIGDRLLKPGETAYVEYTNVSSVPLRIQTVDGLYELFISNDTDGTRLSTSDTYLNPNNTTYSNAISGFQMYGTLNFGETGAISTNGYKYYMSQFAMPPFRIPLVVATISTRLKAKSLTAHGIGVGASNYRQSSLMSSYWEDTTTAWTSLGTLVFNGAQSGKAVIRRLV